LWVLKVNLVHEATKAELCASSRIILLMLPTVQASIHHLLRSRGVLYQNIIHMAHQLKGKDLPEYLGVSANMISGLIKAEIGGSS
jgi:hypothetical protein